MKLMPYLKTKSLSILVFNSLHKNNEIDFSYPGLEKVGIKDKQDEQWICLRNHHKCLTFVFLENDEPKIFSNSFNVFMRLLCLIVALLKVDRK